MSQRLQRVNQLLKQEISKLLLQEIDFADILVTITNAQVSPDLRQAKIKISVMPFKKSELALQIIQRNIYSLQQELNKKLHMKSIPKISFEIDKAEAKTQRIEEILGEMKKP